MADADQSLVPFDLSAGERPLGLVPFRAGQHGEASEKLQDEIQKKVVSWTNELTTIDPSGHLDISKFDLAFEITKEGQQQMRMVLTDALKALNGKIDEVISAIPTNDPQ